MAGLYSECIQEYHLGWILFFDSTDGELRVISEFLRDDFPNLKCEGQDQITFSSIAVGSRIRGKYEKRLISRFIKSSYSPYFPPNQF